MKKILSILTICLLVATLSSCGGGTKAKYEKVAEGINKQMPMELENNLRIDRAEAASENTFKYYYTFTAEVIVSPEDFIKDTKEIMLASLKDLPDAKVFGEDNMTLVYVYNTQDGNLFAEIEITPEEYKK